MFEQREDNASINQYCPDTQILIPSIADPGSWSPISPREKLL